MKCTQIRKHESRFYRRPEVPLKYPHRANERAMAGAKERASRLGATISSLTLILGISPARLSRYARYCELFKVLVETYETHMRSLKYGSRHPPHSLLLPVSLYVIVAALTVTRRSFHGGSAPPASVNAPGRDIVHIRISIGSER